MYGAVDCVAAILHWKTDDDDDDDDEGDFIVGGS